MEPSHQILRKALQKVGLKKAARDIHISSALIYKWCQESSKKDAQRTTSGALNPLDRLKRIYDLTQDEEIIQWICAMADGFFVHNPPTDAGADSCEDKIFKNIQKFIEEFSETLQTISESYSNDNQISEDEAAVIRKRWEDLKGIGESFVKACESGKFNKRGPKRSRSIKEEWDES